MTLGLILGTGLSLNESAPMVRKLKEQGALLFGCNNTYQDFDLDVHLACDPLWHQHFGRVTGRFDRWHWSIDVCAAYGYEYVQGVWIVNGIAYPREQYETPPGPCGGLWMADKTRISLNHCSAAMLLNLACNQYRCSTVLLVGHDFKYEPGKPRHYFSDLSDTPGEYPAPLRKHSLFKKPSGDDLLAVYRRIADQEGLPEIINATPGSALPWFPFGSLHDYA